MPRTDHSVEVEDLTEEEIEAERERLKGGDS